MQLQWLVLAILLVAIAVDHRVLWRGFLRHAAHDPARARRVLWAQWIVMLWSCSLLAMGAWLVEGRPLATLGLAWPTGWRLGLPAVLVVAFLLLQSSAARRIARLSGDKAALRKQLGATARILPHRASELPAWMLASVTAGFCEELLFRGFAVAVLQAVVGWWLAAALSLALFSVAHAYQGREGLVRSAVVGVGMAAMTALTQSLWPAIVLHVVIDAMGGVVGLLILRDAAQPEGRAQAAA